MTQLTTKNFDYSVVDKETGEVVVLPDRWVYIFGMENEGDMFGGLLGIGTGDLYKIGTTVNPIRRWQQVQVHSPWELRCFAVIPGGFDVETEIHRRLDNYRTRGEWFNVSRPTMIKFLEEFDSSAGQTLFPSLPWACYALKHREGSE